MAADHDPLARTDAGRSVDTVQNPAISALPRMMRAARYHAVGSPFSIDEIEVPIPRSTDVLVRVKACGFVPNIINVVHHIANHPGLHSPPRPAIYGLDAAGIIVDTGAQVRGVKVGDRVYVNPLRYCGSCRACRMGNVKACDHVVLNGYFGLGAHSQQMFEDYPYGGFAEYMTAPPYSLVKLPDTLSFEAAARWGYLGTSYSALRRAHVNMSTSVLINGVSGTLGLGALLFALALGAPKILGVARNGALLQKVKALAPERIEVLSVEEGSSIEAWARSLTDGHGVDVVIDALPTGSPPASFNAALAALAKCGRHVNIGGVYAEVPTRFLDVMNKNQTLIGSFWFSTAEGQEMADLAASNRVNLRVLEHKVFPLEDINMALSTISDRNGGFSNYVIAPGAEMTGRVD